MNNTSKGSLSGIVKIIGIITLGLSAAMLLVAAVALIGAAVLNLLGFTNAPFQVGTIAVTGFAQIAFSIVIDAGLVALAALCWKGIKKLRN